MDYQKKSYGRTEECDSIYKRFEAGCNVAMPGPRRLGKTFLLDRMVEAGAGRNWQSIKAEVAGCLSTRDFFRLLCDKISRHHSNRAKLLAWLSQRLGQAINPRNDSDGPWYQQFLNLDHESCFERLLSAMNENQDHRWALLVDELPIFLKALHDRNEEGPRIARDFMNHFSRLRTDYPRIRWLITGSIGLEPLARAGDYMGVLSKFDPFKLEPLTEDQSEDYVIDLAQTGQLVDRKTVTPEEAKAVVRNIGWRSAFYLQALAKKLKGTPQEDVAGAKVAVQEALQRLLDPSESSTFGVWEEHLRKHYSDADRAIAFSLLKALSKQEFGLGLDALLPQIGKEHLTRDSLGLLLRRLETEGFVTVEDWDSTDPRVNIQNILLRLWWKRFPPQ